MSWEIAGGLAIGLMLGYVAMMYITRAVKKDATAKSFASFVAVILAGTAVTFLADRLGADSNIYGAYGVGFGLGFILYLILYRLGGPSRSATLFPLRS